MEPTIGPPPPTSRARRIQQQRIMERLLPLAVEITKGWKPEAHEHVIRGAFERAGLCPTSALVARLGWRTRAARLQRMAEYRARESTAAREAAIEAFEIHGNAIHCTWREPDQKPTIDEMLAADQAHADASTVLIRSLKRKLTAAEQALAEVNKARAQMGDELEKVREEAAIAERKRAAAEEQLFYETRRRQSLELRCGVGGGATGRKPFAQDGVAGDPLAVYERLEPMPAAYVEERLRAVSDGLARGDYVPDSKGNCERAIYRLVNLLSQKFRGDGA